MAFERNIPFNELPNLPPADFVESPEILRHLAKAARHLGELNGLCASLLDPQILINTIILQESKESSAIENIVTTQDELYKAAAEDDTSNLGAKEVLSYKEALYVGLKRMRDQKNLLLTNTMVEIVQTIKQNDAGIRNVPGTALKNAINGEIVYTPPCCEDVLREKLSALEQFINDPELSALDPLIKMAFIHYQFEAIHPFADGNGRTGRILNALYLVQQDLLIQPVLYLSSYIVKHKADYYQLLKSVTEKENWNDWIMYMLTALIETTQLTTKKIKAMLSLKSDFETNMKLVLGSSFSYELLQLMFTLPYLKIDLLVNKEIAHRQTASTWLKKLTDADILRPQKMGRTTYYINYRLMEILTSNYL
ncbi:MAG TPA: Fic/DOC family N-terminal domain-containing protein [Sediminibacterium sp.]|uniref:Fic family protein n=1 Tax=Sediminibacterium sp. TaxID=1917865 RepID=UPI0026AFAA9E|nr:Fic/DOC family N-terminal domain-containing protein [Sediminibacterium sp.]HQS23186.1 Fic/DOC family N-terminal domain-containing protein [Sediminibacterium sp.]HQS35861.1 Fic/DOC family N-terminal domain-containing protein [Sediminibacterium sp.]